MKTIAVSLLAAAAFSAQAAPVFTAEAPALRKGPLAEKYFSHSFGCSGENSRPALQWRHPPAGTRSYAVTFYDRDAPTGSGFWQWVVTDLPASLTGLQENGLPAAARQQRNDAGIAAWLGPCPPPGSTHRYEFHIHALDTPSLKVPEGASAALAGYLIYQHTLARADIPFRVSRPRR